MLTVDYDRLGLQPGDRLLDLGLRRRPPRLRGLPPRRPGRGLRLLRVAELKDVRGDCSAPWPRPARSPTDGCTGAVNGDAHAPAVPRRHLRPHHRLRGDGAHPRRRAAPSPSSPGCSSPGGTLAVTVPAWLPEKVCWALSDEYHAPVRRGRPRAHLHRGRAARHACAPPGSTPGASHHAHALHSPYWWLKCAVGPDQRRPPAGRGLPPAPGVGHRQGARSRLTELHRAAAQPGPRQEPRRLRHASREAPHEPRAPMTSTGRRSTARRARRRRVDAHRRVAAAQRA